MTCSYKLCMCCCLADLSTHEQLKCFASRKTASERKSGQTLKLCLFSCVFMAQGARTLRARSPNAAVQTTQTQIAAFLAAAGNAVQYVREDEAVQLSTTVSLRMGI